MNVDTGQWQAVTAERDQLRDELPVLRGHMVTMAEAIGAFGDYLIAHPAPAWHSRPRHARPRAGYLRLVPDRPPGRCAGQ